LNLYDPWELNGMGLIFTSICCCFCLSHSWVLMSNIFTGKALQSGNQWYFFSHATQTRTSPNGHWKPIADETVISGGCNVGLKKTLIFFIGEPFEAIKTNWVMHEYHLMDGSTNCSSSSTSSSSSKRSHKKKGHSDTVSAVLLYACLFIVFSTIYQLHDYLTWLTYMHAWSLQESKNWVICRVFESSYDSQVSFHEEGTELSCLDEVFLSLDDYDEVSFAK
jgi:hypothetical protein